MVRGVSSETTMDDLYWLSDEAWAKIEPHLPHGRPGARRVDNRRGSAASCMCSDRAAAGAMHPPSTARARHCTTATTDGRARGSGGSARYLQSCSTSVVFFSPI